MRYQHHHQQCFQALKSLSTTHPAPSPSSVQLHITNLAFNFSRHRPQTPPTLSARTFTTTPYLNSTARNRVHPSIRRPADFHTLLQSAATTNTLLLTLFKTGACSSCAQITPLLESLLQNRPQPSPGDRYSSIAFAELELDSQDRDDGSGGSGWTSMYDVGIEYAVRSVPTLIGFGGRRAERVTDRLADEKKLKDREFMRTWIDEAMQKGDPHPSQGGGLFSRLFGGGGS